MTRFDVPEMSCGHCTAAIRNAVTAVEPSARVECDLNARVVSVESALGDEAVVLAIKKAGYDATAIVAA
ncbi:heavy-metal-associated domain-containing protein [Defluviimonas sp. SAOS-178_SWC]|uniref:heavy-metal-associated domain-containing protein n=1 Tax=Defluviimonas sp. SAOS-178_SWC TaxID=3121287 RepID=UPI003221C1B6